MQKEICKLCGKVELVIKRETENVIIRGETVEYENEYCNCLYCGAEYENPNMMDKNLKKARDAYRKKVSLLISDKIINIRKMLSLSQRDMSLILGMGEATIARIESKIIQDRSANDSMRCIVEYPLFFIKKIDAT